LEHAGDIVSHQKIENVKGRTYHSELIERQAFTASLDDTSSSSACETQGRDGKLWNFKETVPLSTNVIEPPKPPANIPNIISDGSNDDNSLAGLILSFRRSNNACDAGDGSRWACQTCKLYQRPTLCRVARWPRLRLVRDMKSLRKTTLLKALSVPVCKNFNQPHLQEAVW
jgi:hypothetical protein